MNEIDDAALDALATLVELEVPEACRSGVGANLMLLAEHAALLAGQPDGDGPP